MALSPDFENLIKKFAKIPYIRPAMLPNIELYMDQVTTFMEDRLGGWRRNPEDKILTKTMINNYTKNKLLPPPEKKKYHQDHILLLNYIYYLKNILSINDIAVLLNPMTKRYWKSEEDMNMRSIYRDILTLQHQMYRDSHQDILNKMEIASHAFDDREMSDDERNYLRQFVFVCLMSFDVSLKKRMIETLIDEMNEKK